ncbi:MAG: M23 family metallopeptidase [Thermoanaerobaculia bacterium]|nr:M23 family metallopeptidase [Thermoanaerobaculia bacterium]
MKTVRRQAILLSLLATFSVVSCASLIEAPAIAEKERSRAVADPQAREFGALLREDLAILVELERMRSPRVANREEQRRSIRIGSSLSVLRMPVAGIEPHDLSDNFGDPRDGGARSHRGIDIFAPRGTQVIAATGGIVTYVGEQRLGGRCLWLRSWDGTMFYYAHLDRWASGLHEGKRVRRGDLLGYVGNTGNAINTPPHLHFQIVSNERALNPYPHLMRSATGYATPVLSGGFGRR